MEQIKLWAFISAFVPTRTTSRIWIEMLQCCMPMQWGINSLAYQVYCTDASFSYAVLCVAIPVASSHSSTHKNNLHMFSYCSAVLIGLVSSTTQPYVAFHTSWLTKEQDMDTTQLTHDIQYWLLRWYPTYSYLRYVAEAVVKTVVSWDIPMVFIKTNAFPWWSNAVHTMTSWYHLLA